MSMLRAARVSVAIFLFAPTLGLADSPVVLDEPEIAAQSGKPRIEVASDGTAVLHLKAVGELRSVDLTLSAFQAAGQSDAVVGFPESVDASGALLPYRSKLALATGGTEIGISAPGLKPGVDYMGTLYATIGRQRLSWQITLMRMRTVPPFQCPADPEMLNVDGTGQIAFSRTPASRVKDVTLKLSPFSSSDQKTGAVELDGNVSLGTDALTLRLRTAGLAEATLYTGKVYFFSGATEFEQCPLSLQMLRSAHPELVTDLQTLSRDVTLPMWFGDSHAANFSFRMFEKSRTLAVDGITAVIEGPSESPGGTFDPERHLRFTVDGSRPASFNLMSGDYRPRVNVPQDRPLDVGMQVNHLRAGKYGFSLRFSGAGTTGLGPKIDVTVNVRHHWIWAVLAVIIALALSYLASKGVASWRERLRIRGQLVALNEERFNAHTYLPSVVFLRAVVAQTEALISRLWIISPPSSVYDYVARAQRVVAIMQRYSAVCEALEGAFCSDAVEYYYHMAIDDIMNRIGPQPLDQKTADDIVNDLNTVAAHLADPTVWYWSTFRREASALAQRAKTVLDDLGDPIVAGALIERLQTLPQTLVDKNETSFDQDYWILTLLYTRRGYTEDIAQLVECYKRHQSFAETTKLADQLAWHRVEKAALAGKVKVTSNDGLDDHECLRPITYLLDFADPAIRESYFVANILKYQWHFKLKPESGEQKTWTVFVDSPRITQYIPAPGMLEVAATLHWQVPDHHREVPAHPLHLKVLENSEIKLSKNLDSTEVLLFLIIMVIALVTSLSSLYLSKPTFGSFADYIAILAWAIGIDQGKNLIQLLKAYPADGADNAADKGRLP
jgi:hypothetical protein